MAASAGRYFVLLALEVRDAALYARYRAAMTPLLELHGGVFEHDFAVARVFRSSAGERVNRVFTMSFPDRAARERFHADAAYRKVRAELFEPAVASATELAEWTAPSPPPDVRAS